MSVRRLAEKQPPSFSFTPENLEWAKALIAKYPAGRQRSAVIPLLTVLPSTTFLAEPLIAPRVFSRPACHCASVIVPWAPPPLAASLVKRPARAP